MLYPLATPPPGLILQPIFYKSAAFVTAVREDVVKILDEFERVWTTQPQGNRTIFQCFKQLWKTTGWCYVHLVNAEPSLRPDWFDTISHCFIEQFDISKPADIRQIGVLFSLYCLELTQPTIEFMVPLPIKLTITLIKHILTFPSLLLIDHRETQSSLDVRYIIAELLANEQSFVYIVPDNIKDYPPLPTNRSINRAHSTELSEEIGKLAASIRAEITTLSNGPTTIACFDQPPNFDGEKWVEALKKSREDYRAARDRAMSDEVGKELVPKAQETARQNVSMLPPSQISMDASEKEVKVEDGENNNRLASLLGGQAGLLELLGPIGDDRLNTIMKALQASGNSTESNTVQ